MRPAKPAWRRNLSGRPAVLPASFDCPISATERGAKRASGSLLSALSAEGWPCGEGWTCGCTALFRCIGLPCALVEAAVENLLGDAVLEDFHRSARDHPAAAAAHAVFHQGIPAVAGRAHGLHRPVCHLEAREIGGRTGEGGPVGG